jgi:predicted transcriptional regulator
MARHRYDLGRAELEVLRALWIEGPATVRAVMEHLHQRGRKVAYTTVQTMLGRLEQKGFARSDRSGVAYVYRAKVSRERFSRSRLRTLLDQLYDGAAGPLALQLIRSERLTPQEIDELRRLIERLDTGSKGQRPGPGGRE